MEIRASCTYNLDAILALRRSGLTKGRMIFFWIASAIMLGDIVLLTAADSFPFWIAGLFLLCVVYVLYLYSWSAKLAYNNNKISKDCVVNYTFREDGFHSSVRTATLTEEADIAYSGSTDKTELTICDQAALSEFFRDEGTVVLFLNERKGGVSFNAELYSLCYTPVGGPSGIFYCEGDTLTSAWGDTYAKEDVIPEQPARQDI